jgi:hypothetical protein
MTVLSAAALVGGLFSFAVLWPYGALTALLGAQLGATFVMFIASLLIAFQRAKVERTQERRVEALLESLDQRGLAMALLDPLTGHLVKIRSPITTRS